jgi:hypothetical protein
MLAIETSGLIGSGVLLNDFSHYSLAQNWIFANMVTWDKLYKVESTEFLSAISARAGQYSNTPLLQECHIK